MRIGSSNPVFRSVRNNSYVSDSSVTYSSVAIRTSLLILITMAVGSYTFMNVGTVLNVGYLIGALIIGAISVFIGTMSVKLSPIFSVTYAVMEGYVLGTLSAMYEYFYDGIVPTAITTTLVILFVTLVLYSTGIVKVTSRFASFLVIGLISVIIMSLLSFILPFGTGSFFYLVVILSAVLSVLFLFYDFENIHSCVEAGTAVEYSWVLSLGLMVTIVWVYVEVLRLIAIFGRRR